MMQFPVTRLKSMQSRLDKLLGLQAAQCAMRARPNYTIYDKWQLPGLPMMPFPITRLKS